MMSELDDNHPHVQRALVWLIRRLAMFYGQPFNQSTEDRLRELLTHLRTTFKRTTGHDFPPLTVFLLPTSRIAAIYRADLDDEAIRIKILNLLRELGVARVPVSVPELVAAIRFAWPWYKPPIEDWRNDRQAARLH